MVSTLAERSTGRPREAATITGETIGSGAGRILAGAGAAFAILVVAGNSIFTGGGPETVGFALELLGYAALIGFVAWAAVSLRGGSAWAANLALLGGATMIGIKLGGWAAVWASRQEGVSGEVAAALIHVDEAAWVLAWMPYGLLIAGLSFAGLRAGRLPGVVAWLGIAVGLACVAAVPFSTGEPFVIPWLVSLLWLIVASIFLTIRRAPRPEQGQDWAVEV
jgi:hypothetical protein